MKGRIASLLPAVPRRLPWRVWPVRNQAKRLAFGQKTIKFRASITGRAGDEFVTADNRGFHHFADFGRARHHQHIRRNPVG
jgi:hypothetical protein